MKRPSPAAAKAQLGAVCALALVLCGTGRAWANDYVVVRGAYYREASTRVIQPLVELQRESPSTGLDVGAHFLIDAITSASIAAGTMVDNVFTEIRDEAGLRVRKRWQRADLSLAYKYSAESDYWSHGVAASFGQRFWGDTAAIRLSLGRGFDTVAAKPPTQLNCTGMPNSQNQPSCPLDVWFGGLSYSQVLSPVAITQISYEAAYLDGYQGNPYRTVASLNNQTEQLPQHRLRNAISPRIAYFFPRSLTGLQLHYRLYFDVYPGQPKTESDPWHLIAQTVEGRVYQQLSPTLEVRVLFRYSRQSHANFWCAAPRPSRLPPTEFCAVSTDPPAGYVAGPDGAQYYTSDPKLGPLHTEYPEVQLAWAADALRDYPFLRWFAGGTFEISYGYYFQSTSYGNAHLLQTAYRLPY